MKKKINVQFIMHILFCISLPFWFSYYSTIRPSSNPSLYKEAFSAIILLTTLYVNLLILIPKLYYRNRKSIYFLLSLFLICLSGITEMWMVESDISKCVRHAISAATYQRFILHTSFMVTLRNGAFYLFFTTFGFHYYTKKNALKEKISIGKKTGILSFIRCDNKGLLMDIDRIIYFQQKGNCTTIHTTSGRCFFVYNSLSQIENYSDILVRINRNTIVNRDKIVSFTHDSLVIKQSKRGRLLSLYYYKIFTSSVYTILQKAVPHLEKKNEKIIPKNDVFGGLVSQKDDETTKYGGLNALILDEILNNPGINTRELVENLKGKIHLRTLERRLSELKNSGKIKSKRGGKERGYYIV